MSNRYYVSFVGKVPSLNFTLIHTPEHSPDLVVNFYAPYRRFVIQLDDDGLDSFGLNAGDYLIFREQRWPTNEQEICLVTFGDESTIRVIENIFGSAVRLRVSADKIPVIELAPTDFCVIGVLDGVVKESLAEFVDYDEKEFDWGC